MIKVKKIIPKIKDQENLILNKEKIIKDQRLKRNLIIKNHFLKSQMIKVKIIFLKINLKKIIHKTTLPLTQKLVFPEKKQITSVQIKKNHQIKNIKILARVILKISIPPGKEENKIILLN